MPTKRRPFRRDATRERHYKQALYRFLADYAKHAGRAQAAARLGLVKSGEQKYKGEFHYWSNVLSAIKWLRAAARRWAEKEALTPVDDART